MGLHLCVNEREVKYNAGLPLQCRSTAQRQIVDQQQSIEEARSRINLMHEDIQREIAAMKVDNHNNLLLCFLQEASLLYHMHLALYPDAPSRCTMQLFGGCHARY